MSAFGKIIKKNFQFSGVKSLELIQWLKKKNKLKDLTSEI